MVSVHGARELLDGIEYVVTFTFGRHGLCGWMDGWMGMVFR